MAFQPQPRNRLGLKLPSLGRMREAPSCRGRAGPSSPVGNHPPPPVPCFMHDSRSSGPLLSCHVLPSGSPSPPINLSLSLTMLSATPRRGGFDEIADMIRDLSLGGSPVTSKLRGALIAASSNVKTSFVISTGKKKRKVDDASSAVPTPSSTAHAKRRRSAIGLTAMATVTPGSASTMPAGSSSTDAAGSGPSYLKVTRARPDQRFQV